MLRAPRVTHPQLAERLLALSEVGAADAHYRLARIVARVLVSVHLRQRDKWCALARALAAQPAVEERLVLQAIGWLERGKEHPSPATSS